ncbi:hypothetical protein SAMN05660841_03356 [Sphingobacterium nematocida]|uniref:Uncharacterized protein n=1 Tax=Sphingobacterium nematocida TaxID=1513896 RepID=A0A1T5FLF2_9SPHI|nr:hypothetical protein SAMN05660841_03356 [Sphingobacterium nematocida]
MIEPRDEDGKVNPELFKKMYIFTFSGTGLAVSCAALGSKFSGIGHGTQDCPCFSLGDSL